MTSQTSQSTDASPQLPRLPNWRAGVAGENIFSPEECAKIIDLCGEMKPGHVTGVQQDQDHRKCQVDWLGIDKPEHQWIFQRAMDVVKQVNATTYRMDLVGFTERLQVTRYDEGHFQDWHMDFGPGRFSIRKLTFTIQLSDQQDYEGGELEILANPDPFAFPKSQGAMILFPTYVVHRVKPVIRGTRFSLVGWIGGPHIR
ncbi:MAG: 2OG-Fe(II) oxygenase [Pseudomonadota bacterium]